MFTLLHISDLHRATDDPVTNDELISSLLVDTNRSRQEDPSVPAPDGIIVSGDLVQGLTVGNPGYPSALGDQYGVALDLLIRLADRFVGGDRSRVVIIPGNHDVDWPASYTAMQREADIPSDVFEMLTRAGSPYRWSWQERALYRVLDQDAYAKRLDFFRKLYREFYGGSGVEGSVDANRDWNIFELDQGRVAVAAFNSCHGNDCFSNASAIPSEAIAAAHMDLRARAADYRLQIAVWHHSVEGIPGRSDFISADTIRLMIDKGFRLGMHGHQHRADALPYNLRVSGDQRMVVVSAGSLCAGRRQLPVGVARQYNIVVIRDDYSGARIHVREAVIPGIFGPGRFPALGGRGHLEVDWTPPEVLLVPVSGMATIATTTRRAIVTAETLIKAGESREAVRLLAPFANELPPFGRKLLLEAIRQSENWPAAIELLQPPLDVEELTMHVRALVAMGEFDRADSLLEDQSSVVGLAAENRKSLAAWISAQRKLRS